MPKRLTIQHGIYNGFGTRISKTDTAGTHTFKRDGAGVTAPVVADGFASFTPGISERRSGTTTYSHSGLKNNAAQSGTGQTVGATRTYDAFGNVVASSGTFKGPFGYAGPFGYQEDGDSGLKLLGHRYYDSSTGRFLTRDPAKDGRNWYVYCDSNPLTRSDPTGGFWDTLLDIASVVLSAIDFIEDPSWETGGGLLADGIALIIPGIPAPGIIRHADDIIDGAGDIGRRISPPTHTNPGLEAADRGRRVHAEIEAPYRGQPDIDVERPLPSRRRPDIVDHTGRHVGEIKPDNERPTRGILAIGRLL